MVYMFNGKFYLLVSGYFCEVKVLKNEKQGYKVEYVKGAKDILARSIEDYTRVSLETAYKKSRTKKIEE